MKTNIIRIDSRVSIPLSEIEFQAIRSSGPGGQNVNKVATAIELRFNTTKSSLPAEWKERIMNYKDQRVSKHGDVIIKASRYRSQSQNQTDAVQRFQTFIRSIVRQPEQRRPTKLPGSQKRKRLDQKKKRGQIKANRGRVTYAANSCD